MQKNSIRQDILVFMGCGSCLFVLVGFVVFIRFVHSVPGNDFVFEINPQIYSDRAALGLYGSIWMSCFGTNPSQNFPIQIDCFG